MIEEQHFQPRKCPNCGEECDTLIIIYTKGDMSDGCSKCQIFSNPIHLERDIRMRVAKEVFGLWAGVE